MKYILLIIAAFSIMGCVDKKPEQGFGPIDPEATKEAGQLLEFLYSIQGKYTLTGQHNFPSNLARYEEVVFNVTGKHPVVWGSDFSFNALGDSIRNFQHCGPMNLTVPFDSCAFNGRSTAELRQGMIDEAIRKHREGRIITLMWHCCFPTEGDSCDGASIWAFDHRPDPEVWNELVTDGTPLNSQWKQQMDGVAVYLKQLQEAKVPVLWRPYHEMNGFWFWWCDHPGENGFKKLWIMTYEYLTTHHRLHNLIWVWNSHAPQPHTPGAGAYADYFPGTGYVDVLAADVYNADYKQSHHDELIQLGNGKLISLGEVGELPTPGQYEAQKNWAWFMVWGYFIHYEKEFESRAKAIYDHPQSITLDEIDFQGNEYKLK